MPLFVREGFNIFFFCTFIDNCLLKRVGAWKFKTSVLALTPRTFVDKKNVVRIHILVRTIQDYLKLNAFSVFVSFLVLFHRQEVCTVLSKIPLDVRSLSFRVKK